MSSTHHGNLLNSVTFEEHDGELNAKKVSLVSGATIYAVVNTSAAGQASVVLDSGISNIGFATVSVSNPTLYAVVNTSAPGISNSIVTVANRVEFYSNVTLNSSPNFIGFVTVANRIDFNSNVTLNSSPNFIGLITVANRLDLNSNVTLNAGANYIGLVTIANRIDLVSNVTLNSSVNSIGFATVQNASAWPDPKTYIGLTTTTLHRGPILGTGDKNAVFVSSVSGSLFKTMIANQNGWIADVFDPGNGVYALGVSIEGIGGGAPQVNAANIDAVNETVSDWTDLSLNMVNNGTSWDRVRTANVANATTGLGTLGAGILGFDGTNYRRVFTDANGILRSIVTVADSKGYIGLVTVGGIGTVTLSDPKGFIGLTTTTLGASPALIGLVTIANRVDLVSNVTLSASDNNIGNVDLASAIPAGANYIGLASVNIGGGNVGLNAGVNNIGFATVQNASAWPDPKTYIGLVTVGGIGTVTLSDPKGYIGLVTIGGIGTLTLSDPKGFIGLVTAQRAYNAEATIHTTIISAGSYATIYVPGAGQRFFLKSLHVSSLGRGEIEFRSGATTLIPMTALSTTSGFFEFYGENGLPARAVDQAFVAHIPSAQTATIAIMVHSRFV